ncbi:MAG: integrin alpha [Actinomycetota bacterium]
MSRSRRRVATAVLAVAAAAAAVAADAAPRAPADTWAEIRGAGSAAAAGDVDGDGHPDVIVSRGDLVQPPSRGHTWVVLGPWPKGRLTSVRRPVAQGFVIEGAKPDDLASRSRAAGDVNGDGFDDVIVGAAVAGTGDRPASGAAYVVFGRRDVADVHLADFDEGTQTNGFRITGPYEFSLAGRAVAALGDVNGDGLDDVAVAAPFAAAVYVVFGKTTTSEVDLAAFETNTQGVAGYRIDVPAPQYDDAVTVGGAGDVNGDRLADVIVGSITRWYEDPGTAYVTFGKPTPEPLDLRALGTRGFAIQGRRPGDATGYSVAGAGDVNGDGFGDVVVGAPRISYHVPGRAAVVFGAAVSTTVRLADLGDRGFLIGRGFDGENVGFSVAGVGDVNVDGVPDVALGAPNASRNGREMSGSVYVIYGRSETDRLNLRKLGRAGYRIDGVFGVPRRCGRDWAFCPGWFGHSVDGIEDVTGDGRRDLVVGAFAVGWRRLGRSYVIRGR